MYSNEQRYCVSQWQLYNLSWLYHSTVPALDFIIPYIILKLGTKIIDWNEHLKQTDYVMIFNCTSLVINDNFFVIYNKFIGKISWYLTHNNLHYLLKRLLCHSGGNKCILLIHMHRECKYWLKNEIYHCKFL